MGLTGELVIHDIVVNDGVNLSTERLEIQASPVDLDAGAIVGFPNGGILLIAPEQGRHCHRRFDQRGNLRRAKFGSH